MPTNTRRMEKVLVTTILVITDSGETHQWMSNHWLGDSWGEEYSHSLKLSSKREKLHRYPDKGEICECHLDQLKKPTAADNGRNWHQVHVSVKCWKGWTSTEYSCQKDERNYENITGQIQTGGHFAKLAELSKMSVLWKDRKEKWGMVLESKESWQLNPTCGPWLDPVLNNNNKNVHKGIIGTHGEIWIWTVCQMVILY